jgi:hypothetical protein
LNASNCAKNLKGFVIIENTFLFKFLFLSFLIQAELFRTNNFTFPFLPVGERARDRGIEIAPPLLCHHKINSSIHKFFTKSNTTSA